MHISAGFSDIRPDSSIRQNGLEAAVWRVLHNLSNWIETTGHRRPKPVVHSGASSLWRGPSKETFAAMAKRGCRREHEPRLD